MTCPRCDYDISGLTTLQCPECGTEISRVELDAYAIAQPKRAAFLRWWRLAAIAEWAFIISIPLAWLSVWRLSSPDVVAGFVVWFAALLLLAAPPRFLLTEREKEAEATYRALWFTSIPVLHAPWSILLVVAMLRKIGVAHGFNPRMDLLFFAECVMWLVSVSLFAFIWSHVRRRLGLRPVRRQFGVRIVLTWLFTGLTSLLAAATVIARW